MKTVIIAYGKGETVRTLTLTGNILSLGYTKVHGGVEKNIEGWGLNTALAGFSNHPDREREILVQSVDEVIEARKQFEKNAKRKRLEFLGRVEVNS